VSQLASATQAELQDALQESRNKSSRGGSNPTTPGGDAARRVIARSRQHARQSVIFTPAIHVHRYPPAVWGDDDEVDDDDEWDVGGYEDEDPSLAEEAALAEQERRGGGGSDSDDGMSWEEALPDPSHLPGTAEEQRRQQELHAQQLQQQKQQQLQQQQEAEQQAAQQQHQQIDEQRRQQQLIAQMMAHQAAAAPSTQGTTSLSVRSPDSREQLVPPQDTSASVPPSSSISPRSISPAEASETKKTPLVVQDNNQRQAQPRSGGPMLLSEVMQRQEEDRKRTREEIGALEDARKKAKSPSNSRTSGGPVKIRKEPQSDDDSGKEKDKKGKSGGLFGRLFDLRKDKHKEKSGGVQTPPRRTTAQVNTPPPVSQHATSLRQRDREQQALYQQQYLTRSPASPSEPQSLIQVSPASRRQGVILLGGASATLSPTSDGRRPRSGSLLIGGNLSGDGSSSVPDLSVIRVFAGKKLQTEATFKTVLLNSSTTSEELVKQAIQRFRLPASDDTANYFLTVKRLGGSSAALRPEEKPLVVFETLAEAALEIPKAKRSSVGSISSIDSNLSQQPAIKQLTMNDFTDDAAIKFYLNRRSESGSDGNATAEEGTSTNSESAQADGENGGIRLRPHNLTIAGATVASERFSSPTFRFALQLLIYPDDLPDDMVFDPLTEAIVFKRTLRDRPHVKASSAPFHRKIFIFPKNITVAEVIEIGLERFGIPDAVVDGGDEVEDNSIKRRSSSRVRYVLNVLVDGKGWLCLFFRPYPPTLISIIPERKLIPSSKVIDAFPRPPSYRPADRRLSDGKRRFLNSMPLLGGPDDVTTEDPVFTLRRVVTYRTSSSRRRLVTPLNEITPQQPHRESSDVKQRHMSKQELITAQRAVWRANQRAILSAQANSQRGVDLLLLNNAMLRSSRYDMDDRTRYSYVEGGETYDISDIMEEEWDSSASAGQGDLLEGVLNRDRVRDGVEEKLHRVLCKVRDGRTIQRTAPSTPPSASTAGNVYSDPGQGEESEASVKRSRSATPIESRGSKADDVLPREQSPASERTVTPDIRRQRSGTLSSTSQGRSTPQQQQQQQPIVVPAPSHSTFSSRKKKHSPSNSAPANRLASQSHSQQLQVPTKSQSLSHSQSPQSQFLYRWSAHAPPSRQWPSPFPRRFHALSTIATAAGELFLFGGETPDRIRNDLYVISTQDFSTTLLQTSGDVPGPRYGHLAVLTSTTLLIWGGRTDFSDQNAQNQSNDDSFYLLNLGTSDLFNVRTRSS
jgi:hypothetical protein